MLNTRGNIAGIPNILPHFNMYLIINKCIPVYTL